jgi:hypothetical protein
MGSKEPLHDPGVTHGICPACSDRQQVADTPVLVVSRSRIDTVPVLQTLLRGTPDIAIVVDRRARERRGGNGHDRILSDRRRSDRRRLPALYLV